MSESAEQFLARAAQEGGRVVSTNDLTVHQISEARFLNKDWVDSWGLGWAILPWHLTTDKDRDREREYFQSTGVMKSAESANGR